MIVLSYDPLYFCVVFCDLSIFISNFIDLIFSLCFLMSLANGLSILFILSKNQLLALLIFAMVSLSFFFFFAFIYALIFKISFLLLTLGFFISSLSSCFRCIRLFIWLFSCFLRYACIAMNFPLSTAFTVSHRFWVVVFSFSFASMQILISFLISSVICWLFSSVLFSLHMLDFFNSFSPVIEI